MRFMLCGLNIIGEKMSPARRGITHVTRCCSNCLLHAKNMNWKEDTGDGKIM